MLRVTAKLRRVLVMVTIRLAGADTSMVLQRVVRFECRSGGYCICRRLAFQAGTYI